MKICEDPFLKDDFDERERIVSRFLHQTADKEFPKWYQAAKIRNPSLKSGFFEDRLCASYALLRSKMLYGASRAVSVGSVRTASDGDHEIFALLDILDRFPRLAYTAEGRNVLFRALTEAKSLRPGLRLEPALARRIVGFLVEGLERTDLFTRDKEEGEKAKAVPSKSEGGAKNAKSGGRGKEEDEEDDEAAERRKEEEEKQKRAEADRQRDEQQLVNVLTLKRTTLLMIAQRILQWSMVEEDQTQKARTASDFEDDILVERKRGLNRVTGGKIEPDNFAFCRSVGVREEALERREVDNLEVCIEPVFSGVQLKFWRDFARRKPSGISEEAYNIRRGSMGTLALEMKYDELRSRRDASMMHACYLREVSDEDSSPKEPFMAVTSTRDLSTGSSVQLGIHKVGDKRVIGRRGASVFFAGIAEIFQSEAYAEWMAQEYLHNKLSVDDLQAQWKSAAMVTNPVGGMVGVAEDLLKTVQLWQRGPGTQKSREHGLAFGISEKTDSESWDGLQGLPKNYDPRGILRTVGYNGQGSENAKIFVIPQKAVWPALMAQLSNHAPDPETAYPALHHEVFFFGVKGYVTQLLANLLKKQLGKAVTQAKEALQSQLEAEASEKSGGSSSRDKKSSLEKVSRLQAPEIIAHLGSAAVLAQFFPQNARTQRKELSISILHLQPALKRVHTGDLRFWKPEGLERHDRYAAKLAEDANNFLLQQIILEPALIDQISGELAGEVVLTAESLLLNPEQRMLGEFLVEEVGIHKYYDGRTRAADWERQNPDKLKQFRDRFAAQWEKKKITLKWTKERYRAVGERRDYLIPENSRKNAELNHLRLLQQLSDCTPNFWQSYTIKDVSWWVPGFDRTNAKRAHRCGQLLNVRVEKKSDYGTSYAVYKVKLSRLPME